MTTTSLPTLKDTPLPITSTAGWPTYTVAVQFDQDDPTAPRCVSESGAPMRVHNVIIHFEEHSGGWSFTEAEAHGVYVHGVGTGNLTVTDLSQHADFSTDTYRPDWLTWLCGHVAPTDPPLDSEPNPQWVELNQLLWAFGEAPLDGLRELYDAGRDRADHLERLRRKLAGDNRFCQYEIDTALAVKALRNLLTLLDHQAYPVERSGLSG